MNVSKRIFIFEEFIYDEFDNKVVFKEKHIVKISMRSAEVLLVLLENAGKTVKKEYFFETVWEHTIVEDGNLAVAIATLRKAFRNCGAEREIIQTIPKRGYRIMCDVEVLDTQRFEELYPQLTEKADDVLPAKDTTEQPIPSKSNNWLWNSLYKRKIIILILLSSVLFLAVLGFQRTVYEGEVPQAKPIKLIIPPFANLNSDEKKEDLLGFAISDRLIANFEKLNGIKIVPIWNATSLVYLNHTPKSDEVKELADFIILGNYSENDETVEVSTRLIRTADWQTLIDKTYHIDANKSFIEIRDLIVQEVVTANGVDGITNGGVLPPTLGSVDQNAYLRYLKGINYLTRNKMEESIIEFEAVTESSPGFANAWIFLSRAHLQLAVRGFGDSSHFEKAEIAIQKALALEPNNFNFRVEEADLLLFTQQYTEAKTRYQELQKEDSLNPSLLLSQSILYRYIGPLDNSIKWTKSFLTETPSAKVVFPQYIYIQDYDSFEAKMPSPEESDYFNYYLGYVNLFKGEKDKAIEFFNKAYQLNMEALLPQTGKVFAYHLEGKTSKAMLVLYSIEIGLAKQAIVDGEVLYMVAQAYAVTGDTENALQTMERAIDAGFLIYEFFEKDPLMENIRSNPMFEKHIDKAKILRIKFETETDSRDLK